MEEGKEYSLQQFKAERDMPWKIAQWENGSVTEYKIT